MMKPPLNYRFARNDGCGAAAPRGRAALTGIALKPSLAHFFQSMEIAAPIPKHTVGRTFMVAISLLGAVALAQAVAVGWIFVKKNKANIAPVVSVGIAKAS